MDATDVGTGALIGAILPLIISAIERPNWDDRTRSLVAFVVCMLAAAGASVFVDGVDVRDPNLDLVAWMGGVYVAAMVSYARFWKPVGTSPTIERLTSGPTPGIGETRVANGVREYWNGKEWVGAPPLE